VTRHEFDLPICGQSGMYERRPSGTIFSRKRGRNDLDDILTEFQPEDQLQRFIEAPVPYISVDLDQLVFRFPPREEFFRHAQNVFRK